MNAAVPIVPVADDGHALRIRRPHAEDRASHTVVRLDVRAEFFPQLPVLPFAEEVRVHIAEQHAERIRIALLPYVSVVPREAKHVCETRAHALDRHLEKSVLRSPLTVP